MGTPVELKQESSSTPITLAMSPVRLDSDELAFDSTKPRLRLRRARLVVVSVFDSAAGRGGMVSWARADGGRRGRAHGGRGRA